MANHDLASRTITTPGIATWVDWTCDVSTWVQDVTLLDEASAIVRSVMLDVEMAASRFREDSEVIGLMSGQPREGSPALIAMITAAVEAAEATNGLLDPTLGRIMRAWGYSAEVPQQVVPQPSIVLDRASTWKDIHIDNNVVSVPQGVLIDLGATAKAWASDRASQRIWQELNVPCVIGIGGDLAIAGPADFRTIVEVAESPTDVAVAVLVGPGGLATSSTVRRTWKVQSATAHHIIDPRTQAPAVGMWRTATVMAATCVAANHAATAAIVMGEPARRWLASLQLPARLIAQTDEVTYTGDWPQDRELA
ncbi:MAG: FAD:protein FMN transferase [Actinobacteria bacterium]|nr:FAD:protein FMN transferase [Actinomycetota bacterium]